MLRASMPKLFTNQDTPPPTCPPSPTNGLALSTCLSANQPIRPQNEDTEVEGQTDSGASWKFRPLQFRPAGVIYHHLLCCCFISCSEFITYISHNALQPPGGAEALYIDDQLLSQQRNQSEAASNLNISSASYTK